MDKIRVLQLGTENFSLFYPVDDRAEYYYEQLLLVEQEEKPFDLVIVDRILTEEEIGILEPVTKAYCYYVTDRVEVTEDMKNFGRRQMSQILPMSQLAAFFKDEVGYYFSQSYGEKYNLKNLCLSDNFRGSVEWDGNYCVNLEGDFHESFTQIAFWRTNIPIMDRQVIDLWLEYKKEGEVEIELVATHYAWGSADKELYTQVFSEEQMKQPVQVCYPKGGQTILFMSLRARGKGVLKLIALHDRYSRGSHGFFLPGGERFVTSEREELFCYFDPGDLKPPFSIYFSGYKTREGFEGYRMMKKMGKPFLLISEARLEGGCFYMGSAEYEDLVKRTILSYIERLGFDLKDVIMSGLSMGTFGAMYYGCDVLPGTILLGKPLASVGNIAANGRLLRPGEFSTSFDVLKYIGGGKEDEAIETVNTRFWQKFEQANWSNTTFAVSYMIEDDYDADAYEQMIAHLKSKGASIYGKGLHGRHNDNTSGIVNWFISQYEMRI